MTPHCACGQPAPNATICTACLDGLRQAFHAAIVGGKLTIWLPPPRRVRLRLWLTGRINAIGIWLVEHGHIEAAVRLWRICGMW